MFAKQPRNILLWAAILILVSLVVGAVGAGFLHALEAVTALYRSTPWLLVTLPFIGLLTVWLYNGPLKASAGGVKTLIAQIKAPTSPLPATMGPSIIGTTLLSHLGGASVGREGTALQMGGAIADQFSRLISLDTSERRTLLLCGVSAGFAAVFGTPIAAAVFALEFVHRRSWAFLPCLATAFLADLIGRKLFFAQLGRHPHPSFLGGRGRRGWLPTCLGGGHGALSLHPLAARDLAVHRAAHGLAL